MSAKIISLADKRRERSSNRALNAYDALVFAGCFGVTSFYIGIYAWIDSLMGAQK